MSNLTAPSVHHYLDELDRALHDLPRARRREILRDISAHIDAALADAPEQSPAVIATILDHLGTPTEIAEAARAELPPDRSRIAARDVIAIVLLLVGGVVVPFVGWLVGVVLLWTSTAWRTRDKLIGTLLVPGGLFAPVLLGGGATFFASTTEDASCGSVSAPTPSSAATVVQQCTTTGGPGIWSTILIIVLLIITVGGPLFSTFWLIRHARRTA
ncbi:HAAS signaling domain-containing protein [Leekyejoonella antrihumi]|uniref:Uncharacterized protein n=1 Tax=Leekyejoonella antrihumi TaxID=1660198 RepID=A0A563E103_9MICO|nr:hypothetical protein [Leekyejoonella antrihumi]TWP36049.1 hypothetical protein FGL98_11395 [Leekyejoonella antrihumi]